MAHRFADDLDQVEAVWFEVPGMGPVVIERYDHSTAPGAEVLVDVSCPRDVALKALARRVGLTRGKFAWVTEHRTFAEQLAAAVAGRSDLSQGDDGAQRASA